MVAVHIKGEARKRDEAAILRSFNKVRPTKADREAAAIVTARSQEAYAALKKMEGKNG